MVWNARTVLLPVTDDRKLTTLFYNSGNEH
jgi:hypothetical protein